MLAGSTRCGGVVSTTVTLNDPEVVPLLFVAVHCTALVPSGNVDPEAGVHVTTPLPVAVTVKVTAAPLGLVASVVMSSGRVSAGAPLVTVTVNEPVVSFALESIAKHCTLVVPNWNVEPEAGEQWTTSAPSI